jgi:transposase-like protein
MTHDELTPAERQALARERMQDRIRAGMKAMLEEIMEEEMTEHLHRRNSCNSYREQTPGRRGERNGSYTRGLITEVGRIEQLKVPRDREGTFLTEVFERYHRMTGSFEEAVLEMYLQGISTRKIERVTGKLSGVQISKDAVSRIAKRLDEELSAWRGRTLTRTYPYLYLDATFLKAIWAGAAEDVALLTAVGVDEKGYREVLAVQAAPGERTEVWRDLLKDLLERKLRGVRLVISDDADAIKTAVSIELPQATRRNFCAWQRCTVHFERNILAKVPQKETKVVAADLKVIFQAARRETAEGLAQGFADRYREVYPKAVACLESGLADALTYTEFPSSHHRYIRTTNGLERLFREVKRRTKVVGVFPSPQIAENLSLAVMLRVSEGWTSRRYLDMEPLHALFYQPTQIAT